MCFPLRWLQVKPPGRLSKCRGTYPGFTLFSAETMCEGPGKSFQKPFKASLSHSRGTIVCRLVSPLPPTELLPQSELSPPPRNPLSSPELLQGRCSFLSPLLLRKPGHLRISTWKTYRVMADILGSDPLVDFSFYSQKSRLKVKNIFSWPFFLSALPNSSKAIRMLRKCRQEKSAHSSIFQDPFSL